MAGSFHQVSDARRMAKRRLPWMVFDYIDGAAGAEKSVARTHAALDAITLTPRVLRNVSERNLSRTVFGKETKLPFGIPPMGLCNLAGPLTDRALGALAAKYNIPLGVSTMSSSSLEDIQNWANGNAWLQLYLSGDGSSSLALIDRAEAAGYDTLILTVDVPEVGRRPRELRHDLNLPLKLKPMHILDCALHPSWSLRTLAAGKPDFANFKEGGFDRTASRALADWDMLARIRDRWKGNLVLKGVMHADDATHAVKAGVDAIQVSSHGCRQMDAALPAITALETIKAALGTDCPLFYDSALRSGEDILRTYHKGASFAFLGRPFLFASAAKGQAGVEEMAELLAIECDIALAQIGETQIDTWAAGDDH